MCSTLCDRNIEIVLVNTAKGKQSHTKAGVRKFKCRTKSKFNPIESERPNKKAGPE
jgi:hypothetical protein